MQNITQVIQWATECLNAQGYSLTTVPANILQTPWSMVMLFATKHGNFYLKQMPASIAMEPKIMQLLAEKFNASVPVVVAINDDLHCFLMQDAGVSLRKYLKTAFDPDLMCQAFTQFSNMQRATEKDFAAFFALGVPDWRLNKYVTLYDELLHDEIFLLDDGVTDQELKVLQGLKSRVAEQCDQLAQYSIPATLVQSDFNTNNIVIDPKTKKLTFLDLGEVVVTHPFISIHNFMLQAAKHEAVIENDPLYIRLKETCFKPWLDIATPSNLDHVYNLIKNLHPLYCALGTHRLLKGINIKDFRAFYADNKPNRVAAFLRDYISAV